MSINATQVTGDFSVSGQIQVEDIEAIANAGFKTLVNNRPDGEAPDQPSSETIQAAAEAAGLAYHYVPVSPSGVAAADTAQLRDILEGCEKPVYAYCRTGNRSTKLHGSAMQPTAAGSDDDAPLSFFEVMGSTLAAMIGVQSKENKERDFQRGNIWHFALAGAIFTVVFIAAMIGIVNLILAS